MTFNASKLVAVPFGQHEDDKHHDQYFAKVFSLGQGDLYLSHTNCGSALYVLASLEFVIMRM